MPRPLNFLHLSTFYPPWSFGGDAIYIHRLARSLGDDGHHVDVAYCRDAYDLLHPAPPPAAFPDHPNVHVHALRHAGGPARARCWRTRRAGRCSRRARSRDLPPAAPL